MIVLVVLAGLLVVAWTPHGPGRWGIRRPDRLRRWAQRWAVRLPGRDRVPDVAAVVSEVASRLRSGAPIDTAWDRAVERVLGTDGPVAAGVSRWPSRDAGAPTRSGRSDGMPSAPGGSVPTGPGYIAGLPEPSGPAGVPVGLSRLAERCRADRTAAGAVETVRAATVLAQTLGAPLAEVLDRCARSVVDAERGQDARRVALAGPRSTARVLMGLPPLGLLLGAGLGADPVATALDGAWGTLAVLTGAGLLVAGARWTRALVAAAEDPAPHRWRRRRAARG